MDTGSHLLFGLTLAGLAHLTPVVANNPAMAQAVMAGTLIGSHAPDFDSMIRLKGFSSYIRHHRGITHSIPSLFIWPAVISIPLASGFGLLDNWPILYLWVFLSVVFHVFLDLLNTYGVQCMRPFTKKWMHQDILNIFEPFLFLLHVFGTVCWLRLHFDPAKVFSIIYGITAGFIVIRAWQHRLFVRKIQRSLEFKGECYVQPTFNWFHWRYVVEDENCFYTGKIVHNKIVLEEVYPKESENPIIQATKGTDGVRAFLAFAQRIHVTCMKIQDGYEVKWSDVRFWYNRKLPFGVDVQLDENLNVVSHKIGWRKKAWDPPFV